MTEYKQCANCQSVKWRGHFAREKIKKDGLSSWCRECKNAYMREHTKKFAQTEKKYPVKKAYPFCGMETNRILPVVDELQNLGHNAHFMFGTNCLTVDGYEFRISLSSDDKGKYILVCGEDEVQLSIASVEKFLRRRRLSKHMEEQT